MKNILIINMVLWFGLCNCRAQSNINYEKILYRGYALNKTFNKSFINKRLIFTREKDTIYINQKLPFNSSKATFHDYGVFFNCHLQKDTIYSITLKRIKLSDIPNYFNNYYRINTVFKNNKDSSKYYEIRRTTKFLIKGYYTRYFDINNQIYEMINFSPGTGCGIIR